MDVRQCVSRAFAGHHKINLHNNKQQKNKELLLGCFLSSIQNDKACAGQCFKGVL